MKIYSDQCDCLSVEIGKLNTLFFATHAQQFAFRKLLHRWQLGSVGEEEYIGVTWQDRDSVAKDFTIIELTGGELNFFDDREMKKNLQQFIKQQILNNETQLSIYREMEQHLLRSFSLLQFEFSDVDFEFEIEELPFEVLMKQCELILTHRDNKALTALDYRKLMITLWLKLQEHTKKPLLIVYHFPENDMGVTDVQVLTEFLAALGITIIVITKTITTCYTLPNENISFIKKNGNIYDILALEKELQLFEMAYTNVTNTQLAQKLAFCDFTNDTALLQEELRRFLESNQF